MVKINSNRKKKKISYATWVLHKAYNGINKLCHIVWFWSYAVNGDTNFIRCISQFLEDLNHSRFRLLTPPVQALERLCNSGFPAEILGECWGLIRIWNASYWWKRNMVAIELTLPMGVADKLEKVVVMWFEAFGAILDLRRFVTDLWNKYIWLYSMP
jgi:hypothetical protein